MIKSTYLFRPKTSATVPAIFARAQTLLQYTLPADFVIFSSAGADETAAFLSMPDNMDALICTDALSLPRLEKFYSPKSDREISLRTALAKLGEWNPVRYLNHDYQPKKVFIFMGFEEVMEGSPEGCIYTHHLGNAATIVEYLANHMVSVMGAAGTSAQA